METMSASTILRVMLPCLLLGSVASAQPAFDDGGFLTPPRAVQNRKFTLDGKLDIGIAGSASLKRHLTEHFGGALNLSYGIGEYFAVDLFAGGGMGRLTNLAHRVRDTANLRGTMTDLANAGALLGTAQLGVRFTPLYGKFNLASELPVHFNLYFVGGAGGAMVEYNSILSCTQDIGTASRCDSFKSETAASMAFNFGGGMRFFFTERLSARVEVRDVLFFDRYNEGIVLNESASKPGTRVSNPGVTHVPLVLLGASFTL